MQFLTIASTRGTAIWVEWQVLHTCLACLLSKVLPFTHLVLFFLYWASWKEPILHQAFSWIRAHGAYQTKDLRIISPSSRFPFRRNLSSSCVPTERQPLDSLWGRRWWRAAEFLRSFRNSQGENRKRRWKWRDRYVGCFLPGWMKTYNPLGYLSQHHFLWI